MAKPLIAVTMGDPCGVGPEIIAKTLADPQLASVCRCLVLGDRHALERGITASGTALRIEIPADGRPPEQPQPGVLYLFPLSELSEEDIAYGRPTQASGRAMFDYINEAVKLCLFGEAAAIVTAPINKEALNRAGYDYPGHTELLANLTGTDEVVMMLSGDRLRVALVTTHAALRDVPALLTAERILNTIKIVHNDLHRFFVRNPRLAVLALNPHCGEGGLFGDEEARIIRPAVDAAREAGIEVVGPLSADTLFHFASQGDYDAVICMYHDQGLIPLKLLHFDDGVNITLGLPIIRTSVDHGTAYDLAGTGRASAASMAAAVRMAAEMALVTQTCRA